MNQMQTQEIIRMIASYQGLSLGNAEEPALLGDVLQLLGGPPPLLLLLHPLDLRRLHLRVEEVSLLAVLAVEGARMHADDAESVDVVVILGLAALPLRRGEPPRSRGGDRRERKGERVRLLRLLLLIALLRSLVVALAVQVLDVDILLDEVGILLHEILDAGVGSVLVHEAADAPRDVLHLTIEEVLNAELFPALEPDNLMM